MGWSVSYTHKFFVDQWSQSICATGSLTKWNKTIYFFTHLFTRIYFILIKRSQHLAHRRKCPHHSQQAGLQSRPNSPLVEARPELDQCCLYRHHHLQPATIRFWSCPFPRGFEGALNLMDLKPPHRQTGEALWVTPENISYHSIKLVLNSSLFFWKNGVQNGIIPDPSDSSLIHLNSGHLNPHPQCSRAHWAEQIVISYYIPPHHWCLYHIVHNGLSRPARRDGRGVVRCQASTLAGNPRSPTFTTHPRIRVNEVNLEHLEKL